MLVTHGSLFSGIGGFDLGFQRAGIKTLWQVEIDDYCRKVLARHFPEAERFAKIEETGRGNLKPVDIVSGGFPCQDISNAGLRIGIDGERSGLWSEMRRVICELRPQFVVVENVSALLNRGIERVLGDLAESGYDAEWDCIPACAIGAPHRRDRVWIVAYPNRTGPPRRNIQTIIPDSLIASSTESQDVADTASGGQPTDGSTSRNTGHADFSSKDVAYANALGRRWRTNDERQAQAQRDGTPNGSDELADSCGERLQTPEFEELQGQRRRQQGRTITQCGAWEFEPDVGRVAHGIPSRVDRLKGLGNALVPQIAEWIGKRIISTF